MVDPLNGAPPPQPPAAAAVSAVSADPIPIPWVADDAADEGDGQSTTRSGRAGQVLGRSNEPGGAVPDMPEGGMCVCVCGV